MPDSICATATPACASEQCCVNLSRTNPAATVHAQSSSQRTSEKPSLFMRYKSAAREEKVPVLKRRGSANERCTS